MGSRPDNSDEVQVVSSLEKKGAALQTMISPPSRAITISLNEERASNDALEQTAEGEGDRLNDRAEPQGEAAKAPAGAAVVKHARRKTGAGMSRQKLRRASRALTEPEVGAATVLFDTPDSSKGEEITSPSGVPQIFGELEHVSPPDPDDEGVTHLADDEIELLVEEGGDVAALQGDATTTSKDKALALDAAPDGAAGEDDEHTILFGEASLLPPVLTGEQRAQQAPERVEPAAQEAEASTEGSSQERERADEEASPAQAPSAVTEEVSPSLPDDKAPSSSVSRQTRKPSSVLGRQVGNIEIVSRVGKGNMGTVYKAVHRTLKTPYAVKVLHRKYSADVNAAERFRREALVCSQLRHPNVVFVTDFGYQKGLGIYIIMEFLDGPTLSPIISQGPMEADRVCRLAAQICDALSAAHRLDITHRDLKPENITVLQGHGQEEFVKVLDFGIASMKARHAASITTQGMVLGTPAYMSPEQIQGLKDEVGPCTDIYALGCIIYEMLTGKLPFFAESPIELCKLHLLETAPLVSVLRPELSGTILERLIARMLEKRIDRRPASMWEVQKLLNAAIREFEQGSESSLLASSALHSVSSFVPPALAFSSTEDSFSPARLELIQSIWNLAPYAAYSRLIKEHPTLLEAADEDFFLTLWAPLMRDLLDQRVGSLEMSASVKVLNLLMGMLMDSEDLNHEQRNRTMRCVAEVISLAEQKRQEVFVEALQDSTKHPNFPVFVLPSWAIAFGSGTWSPLKHRTDEEHAWGVLQDVNKVELIEPSSPEEELPDLFGISTIEREAMLHQRHSADFSESNKLVEVEGVVNTDDVLDVPLQRVGKSSESLIAKLRRPVTVDSIKDVLSHELFGVDEPE